MWNTDCSLIRRTHKHGPPGPLLQKELRQLTVQEPALLITDLGVPMDSCSPADPSTVNAGDICAVRAGRGLQRKSRNVFQAPKTWALQEAWERGRCLQQSWLVGCVSD
jgi:hypothetical protein